MVKNFQRVYPATPEVKSAPSNAEVITDDGTTFHVHRAILAQQSIFFSKLFAHNGKLTQFHVGGISSAALRSIFNWMYTVSAVDIDPNLSTLEVLLS